MEFLELKDISEQFMELVNPVTPEKVLVAGRRLGLEGGSRVMDSGCGHGECPALRAEEFGISGVGVDLREAVCERARRKMERRGG